MNTVELALEKQRLQLEAAAQRAVLASHLAGLAPVFTVADRVNAGVHWLGRHPEVVVGGVVAAVVRPGVRRFLWRWGRRAFIVWRLWRDSLGPMSADRQRV